MSKKAEIQMVRISPTVIAPVDIFTARRVRTGKTARDRKSGATARRLNNRAIRRAWQDEKNCSNASFPYHICNGQSNRSLVTVGVNEEGACIQKYVGPSTWMGRKISAA